jgi:hypothetical protein
MVRQMRSKSAFARTTVTVGHFCSGTACRHLPTAIGSMSASATGLAIDSLNAIASATANG